MIPFTSSSPEEQTCLTDLDPVAVVQGSRAGHDLAVDLGPAGRGEAGQAIVAAVDDDLGMLPGDG
jgi:hypothetical protein